MHSELIDTPLRMNLVGYHGALAGESVAVVGKSLMDIMWNEVQRLGIKTNGINYWVYLPDAMMFTGVELADDTAGIGTLEKLEVLLNRYLRHLHTGTYSALSQIWPQLFAELKQLGETPAKPHVEIYGNWNPDPAKCETTILIGLA